MHGLAGGLALGVQGIQTDQSVFQIQFHDEPSRGGDFVAAFLYDLAAKPSAADGGEGVDDLDALVVQEISAIIE